MASSLFRLAIAAALLTVPAALPAQRMSDGYEFLKAVRDANGDKVTKILDKPGSRIINTRDDAGDGALHIVAKRGDSTYLRFLVARGADVNLADGRGNTPLMIAIGSSCFDCVDALIRLKANINLGNASGETPLIRAVQLRNMDLARTLLDAGATPDQRDVIAGLSAREYAARDGRSPALTKLLADAPKAGSTRGVSGPRL